jgi:hypothetical protein
MTKEARFKVIQIQIYYATRLLIIGVVCFVVSLLSNNWLSSELFSMVLILASLIFLRSLARNFLSYQVALTTYYDDLIESLAYVEVTDPLQEKLVLSKVKKVDMLKKLFDDIKMEPKNLDDILQTKQNTQTVKELPSEVTKPKVEVKKIIEDAKKKPDEAIKPAIEDSKAQPKTEALKTSSNINTQIETKIKQESVIAEQVLPKPVEQAKIEPKVEAVKPIMPQVDPIKEAPKPVEKTPKSMGELKWNSIEIEDK